MGDVRTLLTQAMRGHWLTTETPESLTDLVLSLPGIAIVALPEPHEEVGDNQPKWYVGDVGDVEVGSASLGRGVRILDIGYDEVCTPTEARALAAVLLAAVNAAERAATNA